MDAIIMNATAHPHAKKDGNAESRLVMPFMNISNRIVQLVQLSHAKVQPLAGLILMVYVKNQLNASQGIIPPVSMMMFIGLIHAEIVGINGMSADLQDAVGIPAMKNTIVISPMGQVRRMNAIAMMILIAPVAIIAI